MPRTSRLEPYRREILSLLHEGRTLAEVRRWLEGEGVVVADSTFRDFVKTVEQQPREAVRTMAAAGRGAARPLRTDGSFALKEEYDMPAPRMHREEVAFPTAEIEEHLKALAEMQGNAARALSERIEAVNEEMKALRKEMSERGGEKAGKDVLESYATSLRTIMQRLDAIDRVPSTVLRKIVLRSFIGTSLLWIVGLIAWAMR